MSKLVQKCPKMIIDFNQRKKCKNRYFKNLKKRFSKNFGHFGTRSLFDETCPVTMHDPEWALFLMNLFKNRALWESLI